MSRTDSVHAVGNGGVPPPLEMQCLNALWALGSGNVMEVRNLIPRDPPLAYTTILTLLDRLVKRGSATRVKDGRGYRYTPAVDRDKLRQAALRSFLDQHFSGSAADLRVFLDQADLDQADLDQADGDAAPKTFAAAAGVHSGLRTE